jgi:hypothetical protein
MGVIQVPGRLSGKTYSVKIKGDTPSDTEQARIRAYLDEQESAFATKYEAALGKPLAEPDDGTAIGRGVSRGAAGAKSLFGTTVETIGQQVGLPSIAEYGRGIEEAAAQRQFQLGLTQPAPTTRQDVAAAEGFFPTIGAGLTYAGELAGEQIPQLGVGLAGGAAGAVAGGLTAGPAGALAGFGIGSGLIEAPLLFGANVQRQEEEVAAGRREAVDLTDALGSTVGQAGLTAVTNALAGAGIFVRPGAKLFTRALSGAAVSGTTESLNEVGQQMLERYQAGLPVDSPDAIQEYIDAGVAGGILGVGAGGVGGAVGGPRVRAQTPPPQEDAAPPAGPLPTIAEGQEQGELFAGLPEQVAEEPTFTGSVRPVQLELPLPSTEQQLSLDLSAAPMGAQGDLFAPEGSPRIPAPQPTERLTDEVTRAVAQNPQLLTAIRAIEATGKPTVKTLQEALGVNYSTAMPIMAQLEKLGVVSKAVGGKRKVSIPPSVATTPATPAEAPVEPPIKVTPTTVPKATVTEAPEVPVPSVNEVDAKAGILPVEAPAPVVVPKPKYRKAAEAAAAVAAPIQEVADDTKAAALKSGEVGAGVEGSGQGVEGGGRPADDVAGAAGIEAPTGEGLGGRVPDTVGAAATAGEQPTPLRIDRVDTTQLQGPDRPTRQLIPGTITPVDPLTLQPTGKPYLEASDVYAPDRVIPGAKPTPAGTVLTGAPTELQLRDAERQLAPIAEIREVAANSAAQSELAAAWAARVADKPELASLIEEYSAPDALVLDDPTTSEDKRRVLDLFQPGVVKKGKEGMAPAENAQAYFSRFKRPIDALEYIVADATLGSQSFKDSKQLAAEVGTLPAGYETISPVEREFFDGMTAERAKEALKWVEANMSPQAQAKVRELQRKYKQAQQAKVPNKVLSSAPSSTAIGGRAANAEERKAMEQELVVQATEDAAKKAESKALAGAARTRMQGLENLLSAVQETKAPIPKRALPKTKLTAEDQIDLVVDKILGLRFNRPQEVLDLYTPLHPAVINALRRGNLTTALRALQLYAPNDRVKRIAGALFPYTEGTSVRLVDDLRDDRNGDKLDGQYRLLDNAKTSEILLDPVYGMNVMVLLHEMTHAATAKELLNKASPMRKRMEKIFADVAPKLGTLNGQKNIFEFVADAFSDPQFQSELARLYPDGKPISASWRFLHEVTNFVRRLLGMPLKALGSALDVTDQMVLEILDYPVNMTEFSSPQEEATLLNRVAQVDGSFPGRTKEFAQQFGDDTSRVLDGASYNAKRAVLGFFNSQSMADVAQYYGIAGARDLQTAIDQHDAAAIKSDSEVDVVLDVGNKWVKNNPNLKPLFDRVVHRSTVNQADPSLPREKAIKKYGADSDKMREYDAIQKDWAAIGKDGRDLYTNMRELYRKQYERLRAAISGKIDFILKDNPELATEVKASIYTKFFDMNKIEPYFPLARKGDFWLEYSAFDPETGTTEPVRETYDSPSARDRAAKELEAMPEVTKGPDGKPITSR